MLKGSASKQPSAVNALGLPPLSKQAVLSVVSRFYKIEIAEVDFAVAHLGRVGRENGKPLSTNAKRAHKWLARQKGKTVTLAQIAKAVWGANPVDSWKVGTTGLVCEIRAKTSMRLLTLHGQKAYKVL